MNQTKCFKCEHEFFIIPEYAKAHGLPDGMCPDCFEDSIITTLKTRPDCGFHGCLQIYVVYRNTKDYPGEYVARIHHIHGTKVGLEIEIFARSKSLDELRNSLPPGLHCMPRHPADDPVVLETWL